MSAVQLTTTTVLAPTRNVLASYHTIHPLLRMEFSSEDELRQFRTSMPLRTDERLQDVPASCNDRSKQYVLRLLSSYGLVSREQALYLCWWEMRVGRRYWRYLTDEER